MDQRCLHTKVLCRFLDVYNVFVLMVNFALCYKKNKLC